MTVSEAFSLYDLYQIQANGGALKTRKNYTTALNSFMRNSGDVPIELITEDTVTRWKIAMQHKGLSPNSIYSNLKKLYKVLKYCQTKGMRVLEPESIDIPSRKRKRNHTWLTKEEVDKTIEAAKTPRDRAIIAALFHTGSRISALLSIDRSHYEEAPIGKDGLKELWVEDKGHPSCLLFNATVRQQIDVYLSSRTDKLKPLFLSGQHKRITVSRVEQIVHEIEETTGIKKNITPHVYRHSYGTDLILNGANLKAVQVLMNHSSIQVTGDIYSHIDTQGARNIFTVAHSH